MPLVRVEVRNEYALGAPELYREAKKEDPKEVLEGVAVAGLVGILRQLGDLAEFAAEVFHGLQEEVTRTSSRSHKLMARVQRIEAALSPLEKALLAQRSHLHFAYTAGSNWHTRIRCEQNHFIYSDLPQLIMDAYEDCRRPPSLHLLDKFDPCGPGSCLKRYSDPTFFKRASGASVEASTDKILKDKKGRKIKKRRSWPRSGKVSRDASFSYNSGRMQFTQLNIGRHSSSSPTASTYDASKRSNLGEQSNWELRIGSGNIESDFRPSYSVELEEHGHSSPSHTASTYDATQRSNLGEQSNWDLRNGSGYIEGNLRPSYSVELEVHGHSSPSQTASTYDATQRSDLYEQSYPDLRNGSDYVEGNFRRSYSVEVEEHGHSSPSQTASTYDATLRSDLAGQSNLDLRDELRYIEGDLRPSYSVEPEKQEFRESISSPVKRHENNFLDYGFLEEKSAAAYDNNQVNISQEQARCSSSSVTWDGNRETLQFTRHDSDNDGMAQEDNHSRHLESCSPNLDQETLCGNNPDFGTLDKMDVQPFDQAVQDPESANVHHDDIESETDHFMDALNTIESESETDIGCTKKREAEHLSNLEEKGVDDGVFELLKHNSECQSSSSESNVLASGTRKQETEHLSNLEEKGVDDGAFELFRHNMECQSSTYESNVLASRPLINGSHGHSPISMSPKSPNGTNGFINEVAAKDEFNSVSMLDNDLQSSQRAGDSLRPSSPQILGSHGNSKHDAANYVESVSSTVSSNFKDGRAGTPITDGTRSSSDSHKHAPETSSVASVTVWTNGGLLGLQPSKPPDFSVVNALPQDPEYKTDGKVSSSIGNVILSHKDSGKPDQTANFKTIEEGFDMDSSRCHEYQESGMPFRKTCWKISPADLDINLGKLGNSLSQNNAKSTGSSVTASGSFLPVNSAVQADKKHQENTRGSSRMFELGNRLLSTGSNKKLLPGGDESTYPAGYKNANAFEQKTHQSVGYRTFSGRSKDLFAGESPILSPSSSPPLEHMKISFQPIDGFESSKLKLKFPDRDTNNESGNDIFPSFQLVPEVSIARYNVGSESDADTFYRSSPSLSDDCQSNQSDESNSEQWESSESPTSKDHDLYDALRRISLTESVSTLPENGRTNHKDIHGNFGLQFPFVENGVQNSEICCSFDLHSLGTINNLFRKELRNDTNPKDLVEPQLVPNPVPPPLPPVQWRGMMPHLDAIENKCEPMTEGSYYTLDLMHSVSTISQPKPAPLNEDQVYTKMQNSKFNSQKSIGQRESHQGKSINETDFLHQIRTKSFSLRPTVTAKPAMSTGASTTVQVTAILEKANAIRQAVGSDGEDDGTWSDT